MQTTTSLLGQSILAIALLCSVVGCGKTQYTGTYTPKVQLKDGAEENPKYPLETVKEKFAKNGAKKLELKSNGRYVFNLGSRVHEGDWWVDDNRIAIRCDTQNGKKMTQNLISEGADRHFDIRDDGGLSRNYDSPDSNLEVVFTKQ